MFPFGIHSDTIPNWVSDTITPNNGNTFGRQRAFHITNSLQNLYRGYSQEVDEYNGIEIGSTTGGSRE